MPQYAKYYIAIVPKGEIQEKATALKHEVKEIFGAKYALKSPAHVTLKMPFRWNEAKEGVLVQRLSDFFKGESPFHVDFRGIGRFGRRVLFIKVSEEPQLMALQGKLKAFCKQELKFQEELSDKAYRPHMTLVSKDLKDTKFDECFQLLRERGFSEGLWVDRVALLKKGERSWEVMTFLTLV